MKINSFKNLIVLSTTVLATMAFAHGSHDKQSSENLNLTPEQIQLEIVKNIKEFKKTLSNQQTVADFEGVRASTNIIPVLYEHKNGETVAQNLKVLKSNVPAYLTNEQIASMQREREIASAASISPSVLTGAATEKADCVIVVNPSFISDLKVFEKIFEKDIKVSNSKEIATEFMVRHEYAHCSQKTELTAALASASFGKIMDLDQKYFTALGANNLLKQTNSLLAQYEAPNKQKNLQNFFTEDQKYDNILFTQIEESWADGLSLLSLYSKNKISVDTFKNLAEERQHMVSEDEAHENHNTSSFLLSLVKSIEQKEIQIEPNESAQSLSQKMSPIWKKYVEQVEKQKNIYENKELEEVSHVKSEVLEDNTATLVAEVKKIDLKNKINKVRELNQKHTQKHSFSL